MSLSYCRLCEAGCGVNVIRDAEGRASRIEPDREHVVTRGFLCTKGHALTELLRDPRRVTEPLARRDGGFERTEWPRAFDEIAGRIERIARESGPDAIAIYQGNPTAFSWAASVATSALARVVGTGRLYTASTIDCAERFVVADLCFGHPLLVTIPDLRRARFALLLGANPAVSTWAQLTSIPRWREEVAAMRRAGGRFVVVDPRRTETAELADEHVAVRPGSDADLLLAMVRVILGEGLEDRRFLDRSTSGLGDLGPFLEPYGVERAAQRTGLDRETIRRLARDFARAPSGFAAGHSGLTMTPRGSIAEWAILLLNAVCGRIDAAGGLLFNPGLLDLVRFGDRLLDRHAPLPDDVRPPARRILDDLPCAGLAPAIETGRVRALLVVAGNPAVTFPNSARVRRALERLDLLVAVDFFENETTRFAHFLLPPPSMLERTDCVLLNSSFLSSPYAQWTDAVSPAPPGVRSEWTIAREIARRLPRLRVRRRVAAEFSRALLAVGPDRTLRWALRLFGRASLEKIRRHPHGLPLGELRPGELMRRLRTRDRRIALAPPAFLPLLRDDARREEARDSLHPFRLLSRRRLGAMNSWIDRPGRLDSSVEIHPDDARSLEIADGDEVRVANARGSFGGRARITPRVLRGTLTAAHSRGAFRFNDLVDDLETDPLTGMPRFNGTSVRIEKGGETHVSPNAKNS